MGYTAYLQALLRPLGVYELSESSRSGGELVALGEAMDAVAQEIQLSLRESIVETAQLAGIDSRLPLFALPVAPVGLCPQRAAITSLLRLQTYGSNAAGLQQALAGCGVNVLLTDGSSPGVVTVIFCDYLSPPPQYDALKALVRQLLPCQLILQFGTYKLYWRAVRTAHWRWRDFCQSSWEQLLLSRP